MAQRVPYQMTKISILAALPYLLVSLLELIPNQETIEHPLIGLITYCSRLCNSPSASFVKICLSGRNSSLALKGVPITGMWWYFCANTHHCLIVLGRSNTPKIAFATWSWHCLLLFRRRYSCNSTSFASSRWIKATRQSW
jgi:hypothetical protein